MDFHPIADIFPMMDKEAFAELAEDIRLRGLEEPIITYDGRILDGRNRYKACLEAHVQPEFEPAECGDDPLGYVIAMNLKRRHLDESQRAMVVARIGNLKAGPGRPKKKDAAASIPTKTAAKTFNVSHDSVERAKRVLQTKNTALIDAVANGVIAVRLAAKLAEQSPEVQAEAVANPSRAAIIVKQKTREGHEADLAHKILALPTKRYGLIYADPEWKFVPWSEETGNDRSAANHYAVSMLDKIKERDVPSIAADDCVLFLWATVPMLPQAIEVMERWGFEYKSHCAWLKDQLGTGYWFRNVHELLLVGTKGNIPGPAQGAQFESAWDAPVGAHSEKPEFAYDIMETYFPTLPKIELNARKARDGWSYWGAEAPVDLDAEPEAAE